MINIFPHSGCYKVEVPSFDFSCHRALRNIRIWSHATFDPEWLCTAIASIPKPSSANPRVPPLRIEIHVSLPHWIMHSGPDDGRVDRYRSMEIDKMVTSWIAVDTQFSWLIGLDPDALSGTSVTGDAGVGIHLDITIPELTTGPGKGIAGLMFPVLSTAKLVRLV